jgi:hypothetical protein
MEPIDGQQGRDLDPARRWFVSRTLPGTVSPRRSCSFWGRTASLNFSADPFSLSLAWSTGRGSNPRIQVLQTCALATSPPVPCHEGARNKALAPLHLGQSRTGHRRKGIKTRAACLSLLRYLVASSFLDRYHVSTFSPAPPPLTRLAASATVAGAGTITSCPGLQSAPTLTLLPSMVCNP